MNNPSKPPPPRPLPTSKFSLLWGVPHLILLVVGIGSAFTRLDALTAERSLPIPRRDPLTITPLYDRPEIVDDEQLIAVLDRLKPALRGPRPKINWVDHALRFWGVEAVFDNPECLSGTEMRELLLDHRIFAEAWGPRERPFLVPDLGRASPSFSFRTQAGQATASHVDHTIAGLAEVGTPLDYPVITPVGEIPLREAFQQSIEEFSLNQLEYEWSALAYAHYLPHVKAWFTTDGRRVTWDLLAQRLMRQRLAQGVCFGNHRLHTLVMLLRIDDEHQLLSNPAREQVIAHLQDATARLVRTQHPEGYWDGSWPGDEWDGPAQVKQGPLGVNADRLLATGHALEWWALAPPELLPPDETLIRAGQWTIREIGGLSDREVTAYYPFLTHAGRALALWRGRFPHQCLPLRAVSGDENPTDEG